jgi:hypothetical protein
MLGTTTMSSTPLAESSGQNLNVLRWLKVIVLLSLILRFTFSQFSLENRTEHNHHLVTITGISWMDKLLVAKSLHMFEKSPHVHR